MDGWSFHDAIGLSSYNIEGGDEENTIKVSRKKTSLIKLAMYRKKKQ